MSRNRSQRGEGKLGCLFGLVLLVVAGVVAYRVIPIKVKAADLRDTVTDEARSASRNDDNRIRGAIIKHAKELELPVTAEQIKIKRGNAHIRIDVEYTVPVEFPGFTYNWKFTPTAENDLF